MAWYYSFTHKRGTEDATTWQQRIRGLYPPDAVIAYAGSFCVVAVEATRRDSKGKTTSELLPYDMTPEAISLLVSDSSRLLGGATLVWFEPWMLGSLQERAAEVVRETTATSDVVDALKASLSQQLRGTDRGSMS